MFVQRLEVGKNPTGVAILIVPTSVLCIHPSKGTLEVVAGLPEFAMKETQKAGRQSSRFKIGIISKWNHQGKKARDMHVGP